jgi:hypothetical protein
MPSLVKDIFGKLSEGPGEEKPFHLQGILTTLQYFKKSSLKTAYCIGIFPQRTTTLKLYC